MNNHPRALRLEVLLHMHRLGMGGPRDLARLMGVSAYYLDKLLGGQRTCQRARESLELILGHALWSNSDHFKKLQSVNAVIPWAIREPKYRLSQACRKAGLRKAALAADRWEMIQALFDHHSKIESKNK